MLTRAEIEINAKTIHNYLETLGTSHYSSAREKGERFWLGNNKI